MTTFIDFRYSRLLSAALFTGEEQEEIELLFDLEQDNYIALDIGADRQSDVLARLLSAEGRSVAELTLDEDSTIALFNQEGHCLAAVQFASDEQRMVGVRIGPCFSGLKVQDDRVEVEQSVFNDASTASLNKLQLECMDGVVVMGRGTGRTMRWGQLYYQRENPLGICVQLTMDWHHLRAGIPLVSTMTAEELVAQGTYRLRFRSYAYDNQDAEMTDFVRLFGCNDPADIAVHLTPALYGAPTPDIPNLAYGVVESDRIHPHVVERCNQMNRLCVPSAFTREVFKRNGVVAPMDVVSHGVDTEFFRPVEVKASLPHGRAFNFLAIGTYVERKNFRHLVRAFLEEFRDSDDVALYLFLRPEYYATQNNVALEFTEWEREWSRDKSAPIYLWTGYLTREHLRNFYANADTYVMPSVEGFGLTLLEAMSCGTPTIGLDYGGVVDFVSRQNGMLIPISKPYLARDIDTLPYVGDRFYEPNRIKLRKAMRHLLENDDVTKRLGARSRADAKVLSWSAVTGKFSDAINRTYADFQAQYQRVQNNKSTNSELVTTSLPLTLVLCVMDDADARKSIDQLRVAANGGARVLCLFTRYARLKDVMRARKYGFLYYRWDGTIRNCKDIARSIYGPSWIAVLNIGEKLVGNIIRLKKFLKSQSPEIAEVKLSCGAGQTESRLFNVRSGKQISATTEYHEMVIEDLPR